MSDTTSIDQLYEQVTNAIVKAEHADASTRGEAYQRVSELEEAIAAVLPPDDPEGALARRGAITAALSAGDTDRAQALMLKYADEACGLR